MKKHKMRRTVKNVSTVLLCVIMYLSFAVGLFMMTLGHTFDNSTELALRAADEEYCEMMHEAVCKTIKNKMSLIPINVDEILVLLEENSIASDTKIATADMLGKLFGEGDAEWAYENEELRTRIEVLLREASDESGIEYAEGSADQVYGMICETVSAELKAVSDIYTAKAAPYAAKLLRLLDFWYIPMLLFAAAAAAELVLKKHHIKNGIYNMILPAYFGAFTVLAASSIMCYKDYLCRTVLDDAMLQRLMQRLYTAVFTDLRTAGLILSSLLLVMGIVMAVTLAMHGHRRRLKAQVTIE